jgi:hypothetical protein
MGNVAEPEAVESIEGNTCGLSMQARRPAGVQGEITHERIASEASSSR